jgi:protocatechuate 3,4-dioxygenase beta subunit
MSKSRLDPASQPPYLYEPYLSSRRRAPAEPLILIPHTISETTGPLFGDTPMAETDNDLTRQCAGEPIGQRMILEGHVTDETGTPIRHSLIEIWQTNAAGRYRHVLDDFPAPHDPNFNGTGRTRTDENGCYRFITIKPGAYPWNNHENAWRPAHIHVSLFGESFVSRFVTQIYFEGDPMLDYDPIYLSVPPQARHRLTAKFDIGLTQHRWALGYRFDIVLRGPESTPPLD